ncbi:MAG: ribonuclease HII [Candidatus Nanoarchaeia archaeon]|nr:ribonuclease HII [Candidatus Haiyanarchaeum thermophilum]MCW1303435.1 ribonuclease HII [Candidatus Haiyanarchaeum thermophilum]MCW1303879.1 ribonuclease HII [Candidatus Haiyanarchaeum thermophilum]MCW1306864.1 ribonuclease HII [Candidatus Haiyanarchaeum thermophilum]MCW1307583.1 ribonuclease HII [Candidatus Haiyanarchaeum thermophilum]
MGPLVICGALFEQNSTWKLFELGVTDSKLLSPKRRAELYRELKNLCSKIYVVKISPKEIDERLEVNTNLNELEAIKFAKIIDEAKPDIAIIDCPSPNPRGFKQLLNRFLEHKCKLIVENYADRNYKVVGAASIIAKVIRDREIRRIERITGKEVGNGYPHDPKAIEFVKNATQSEKQFIRRSWQTYIRIKKEKEQRKLRDFERNT